LRNSPSRPFHGPALNRPSGPFQSSSFWEQPPSLAGLFIAPLAQKQRDRPITDRRWRDTSTGHQFLVRECKASSSALPFKQALSDARSDADANLPVKRNKSRQPGQSHGGSATLFTGSKLCGHVAKREAARASEARGEIRGDASSPMPTNFQDPVV
jgi:hypothetical protein